MSCRDAPHEYGLFRRVNALVRTGAVVQACFNGAFGGVLGVEQIPATERGDANRLARCINCLGSGCYWAFPVSLAGLSCSIKNSTRRFSARPWSV